MLILELVTYKINTCPIKVCKTQLGLSHEALYTIYKGAILPLLLYGAPVWIEARRRNATKQYTTEYSALLT